MGRATPELTPEASREVDEAFDWYFERSERAAAGFMRELDRALSLIAEAPEIWPPYELGSKRMLLRKYPYGVIFRERGGVLEVVAVAHQSRKPRYWRDR